ncbi:hypothetical protein [Conexibacter woesei]|uniref:hypothetical protein n=1 Tax=Conexibacter woesei TaxID=191495 RepID=UPI0003F66D83|nr:hypothetical protein [Conexibacter woesei]
MRTRVGRTWAYLLRGLGLAITLGGLVVAVASLSRTWVKDGPSRGVEVPRTGWDWLGPWAALLLAAVVLTAILAIALTAGPRSRKVSRTAGGFALTILALAIAAVGVVDWMVGLDFSFFTDNDTNYIVGPGFQAAAIGLGVAVFGLLVLLAGRWDARTRASLKRERRGREAAAA